MKVNLFVLAVVAAAATGCATPYKAGPGEATARVNLRETGSVHICAGDKRYSVSSDVGEAYATFPAQQPISIFAHKVVGGTSTGTYSVTYTCSPGMGVTLDANKSYFLNFEMMESRCRLEMYEETDKSRVGLLPVMPQKSQTCK